MVRLFFWSYVCSYLAISMAHSIIRDLLLLFCRSFWRVYRRLPFPFWKIAKYFEGNVKGWTPKWTRDIHMSNERYTNTCWLEYAIYGGYTYMKITWTFLCVHSVTHRTSHHVSTGEENGNNSELVVVSVCVPCIRNHRCCIYIFIDFCAPKYICIV